MPHPTWSTALVLVALVSTLPALGGCSGGDAPARFGGGTVSMELDSAEGELGIEATGTAAGSDPANTAFGGAGGYVERDEEGGQRGDACVPLDREPDAFCGADTLCVEWASTSGDAATVTPYLDDANGGRRTGTQGESSTYSADGAAGSLTVERVEWDDGDDACGISAISVEWDFDEAAPYKL
ncbi:MAG: hypothetical protein V4850_04545 [Myxococcota bacterium]